MKKFLVFLIILMSAVTLLIGGCSNNAKRIESKAPTAKTDNLRKDIEDIKGALPKFAIPMREVGNRFDNLYFAAKGGNWALAAYMSKYMDKAMNPAKVTKPAEYKVWESFYKGTFDPVNKAIAAKDFTAFDTAYIKAISDCNKCHDSTGYKFIKVIKVPAPKDAHLDYTIKSEPGDVPK